MKCKSESLEKKLDKPDWKQWLPIWGVYQIVKDGVNGKPSIIINRTEQGVEPAKPRVFFGSMAYQAASVLVVGAGLYQLAEKLF